MRRGEHYDDPLNVAFRQLKDQCGWNGSKIATILDLTPGVISQYIHGHTRPSTLALKALQRAVADDASGQGGEPAASSLVLKHPTFSPEDVAGAFRRIKSKAKALIAEIERSRRSIGSHLRPE